MSLLALAGTNSATGGYDIDNSLKLESDNNEHLYVTTMTSGNRRTWTYSIWFKRTELGFTNVLIHFGVNSNVCRMMLDDSDQLWVDICDTGSTNYRSKTNRLFRDTSAWYHVVLRVDTTQSTEADRMKVYVNGVEETSWAQHQIPPQNFDTLANTTVGAYEAMGIGTYVWAGGSYDGNFSGYISQVAHVDGQSYAPTEFGEFDDDTGIWKPKDITELTYGSSNNSFLLDFSDSADLGNDSSGNNNDWSLSNITSADQATDTPTNNFCTLNILQDYDPIVFTEGATNASTASGGNVKYHAEANMGFSSGKWYMEFYVASSSSSDDAMFGFGRPGLHSGKGQNSPGNDTYSFGAHNVSRWYYNNQTWTNTGASGWDKGQVIQIAIDADNGKAWQGVNGTYSSGNPSTGSGGFDWGSLLTNVSVGDLLIPYTRTMYTGPGLTAYNFGGYTALAMNSVVSDGNGYGSFEYAPPSGYYALCTKNLAEYGGTA